MPIEDNLISFGTASLHWISAISALAVEVWETSKVWETLKVWETSSSYLLLYFHQGGGGGEQAGSSRQLQRFTTDPERGQGELRPVAGLLPHSPATFNCHLAGTPDTCDLLTKTP